MAQSSIPAEQETFAIASSPAAQTAARLYSALCYLLVFSIAYCCFVVHRADPPRIFWDENYHVTSAERYLEGLAHFEPHPPLGLMFIAAGEAWSGANTDIDKHILVTTKQISGDDLPKDFSFAGMRLMPSLFAAFGALAFFALMYELTQHRLHALLLSSLYLFENAFTVHFRAVHLDSFQMFFSIVALWQFMRYWRRVTPLHAGHYALLSIWCALAIMVKVNAIVLLAMFPILYFKDAGTQPRAWSQHLRDFAVKSAAACIALALVCFCVFYVHALNTRQMPDASTSAGRQDIENMSPAYRTYLEQQQTLTPGMVFIIAKDYFMFMDKDHKGVPKLDTNKPGENGSHPLHWPFHDRNINYRWDSADGKTAYVELVGNQLSWYSGTAAVIFSLVLIINFRLFAIPPRSSLRTYHLIEVFSTLYVAFMLLHSWIITQRVMYLYHYFLGLMFSYVLLALLWQYLSEVYAGFAKHRTAILAWACGAYFISYLFFLPLSNHWPLTKEECERRNISISHILDCK
ncbi:MAG: phospholipid carrier-dependent glycosyltransferase [Steroidobacteraceae bacterium]